MAAYIFEQVPCENNILKLKNGVARRVTGSVKHTDVLVRPSGIICFSDGNFLRPYNRFNGAFYTGTLLFADDVGNILCRSLKFRSCRFLQLFCVPDMVNVVMREQDRANIAGGNSEFPELRQNLPGMAGHSRIDQK